MKMQNNIKVLSANCQDLRNYDKRHDILTHFKDMGANILCRTNARGVAVLLNDNFEYQVISSEIDKDGNYIKII